MVLWIGRLALSGGRFGVGRHSCEARIRSDGSFFIGPGFGARFTRGRLGVGLEADMQLLFLEKATALMMPVKVYAVF
jgi:hypothetical protein